MQRAEDRRRGFAGPQLRVEQPLGRVVDDGDQRLPLRGPMPQPDMRTAIQVQEFAKARARLPPPAVPTPRPGLAHQPGLLQGEPDEAIGQRHGVLPSGEAVEVTDVPARKALAIEPQNALHFRRRRLAARRAHPPAVIEGHGPAGFITGAPAPHTARIDAQDVGRLQPGDGSTQRPHDDLLDLHGPLHGGRGIEHGHLLRPWLYPKPPAKRTVHLLSGAERSCAPYSRLRAG